MSCLKQASVSLESSDVCCCSRRGRVDIVLLTLHLQMEKSILSLQLLYLEGGSSLQRVDKGLQVLDLSPRLCDFEHQILSILLLL